MGVIKGLLPIAGGGGGGGGGSEKYLVRLGWY